MTIDEIRDQLSNVLLRADEYPAIPHKLKHFEIRIADLLRDIDESEWNVCRVANYLNVSRVYAVWLFKEGKLPNCGGAGLMARVRYEDLRAYREESRRKRSEALDELVRMGQEMGDYDDDPYCKECGNDERRKLAFEATYADSEAWTCNVCGHRFHAARRIKDES